MFLNTHLDNDSDDQRKLGSSMILARARFEAAASGGLVFLSGDLNRHVFFDKTLGPSDH